VIFLLLCSFSSTEIAAYIGLLFTSNELILTKNGLDYILGAFGRFWAALLGFFHKLIQSLCLQFVFSFQKSVIVALKFSTPRPTLGTNLIKNHFGRKLFGQIFIITFW
jgi:hypothetical protein